METLRALRPSRIEVIAADSPFAAARVAAGAVPAVEGSLDQIAQELEDIAREIEIRRIRSNTGFVICDVVQDAAPDFLLVESEWKGRHRVLPPHLGWLEQVIPCRLFLFGKPPREVTACAVATRPQ